MTGERYITSVIDHVPHGLPLRHHIALELRGHIAERTGQGQPLDDVLRQLGDPLTLAESYLAAMPLESASILRRLAAKAIDVGAVAGSVLTVVVALWFALPMEVRYFLPVAGILLGVLAYFVSTTAAEYYFGWTLGKHVMNIVVVRESGARITLGQALLRQLPFFLQFFWIDVLFALFTDRRQRAFELLTKTRVVQGPAGPPSVRPAGLQVGVLL